VALSAILRVALRVPAAIGLNVTLMVQVEPALTLTPQLLVWAKSVGLAPEKAMPVTLSDAFPLFVSVTV